jgi:plastocyanin
MKFPFNSFVACAFVAGSISAIPVQASADEHTVSMTGRTFSPTVLRIQAGDTIRFVNDDTVSHEVFSLTQGYFFASGRRAPGKHAVFVFNRPGAFDVISAAQYDKMKLHVEVASR